MQYLHWTDLYCLSCSSEWRVAGLELISGHSCICYLSQNRERRWLMHQHITTSVASERDTFVVMTLANFVMISPRGGVLSIVDIGPFVVPRF